MNVKNQKPYPERTDLEKIKSNWAKTRGLMSRKDKKECSAAITRAATAVELAANFVIRQELVESRGLESKFVDSLLRWANGVKGKMEKLILPICEGTHKHRLFMHINSKIVNIDNERNTVVHRGEFKSEETARSIISEAYEVITILVREYEPSFKLKEIT